MYRITCLLWILLISWLAVSYAAEPIKYQRRIDDLPWNGVIVSPKGSEKEVLAQLGSPTKKETRPVHNAYFDFEDLLIFYEYPGLTIVFYQFAHPNQGWTKLVKVHVKSDRWPLKDGLKVGLRRDLVADILGPFHESSQADGKLYWFYFPTDEEPHLQIICVFEEGVLTELVWSHTP